MTLWFNKLVSYKLSSNPIFDSINNNSIFLSLGKFMNRIFCCPSEIVWKCWLDSIVQTRRKYVPTDACTAVQGVTSSRHHREFIKDRSRTSRHYGVDVFKEKGGGFIWSPLHREASASRTACDENCSLVVPGQAWYRAIATAIADPTLQRRASCRRRAIYPARELAVFVIFHHFFFAWFPCIYFTF